MKERCNNPNDKGFSRYGGRGIKLCEEWEHDFSKFREWAYSTGYDETLPRGVMTIERIDVNKGYCPENCKWVTMKTQANNKRCNHLLTHNGETKTLAEWSEITKIPYHTLYKRIVTYKKDTDKSLEKGVRKYAYKT
jgi:hypothetical protein